MTHCPLAKEIEDIVAFCSLGEFAFDPLMAGVACNAEMNAKQKRDEMAEQWIAG
jgi:hypothetical protein